MQPQQEYGADGVGLTIDPEEDDAPRLGAPTDRVLDPLEKRPTQFDNEEDTNIAQAHINAYFDGEGYFGARNGRIIFLCTNLLFFSFLGAIAWLDFNKFEDMNESFRGGFTCSAMGLLLFLFGTILTIILNGAKLLGKCSDDDIADNNPTLNLVIFIVFYVCGAILYLIGGCAISASFNDSKTDLLKLYQDMEPSALAGAAFAEALFVSAVAVLLGADVYKNVLNHCSEENFFWRQLLFIATYLFCGFILFLSYAVCGSSGKSGAYNTMAAGWFFVLLALGLMLLCGCLASRMNTFKIFYKSYRTKVNTVIIILMLLGAFLNAVGLWSIDYFDAGMGAYSWGFGFFTLTLFFFTSFDLVLGDVIKNCRKK